MNETAAVVLVLSALAIVAVPRRWAALPLLICACYMPVGQSVEVGPFTVTVLRAIVADGAARLLSRREWPVGGLNRLDAAVLAWGVWLFVSSGFHADVASTTVSHLGTLYNTWGVYFL